MKECPSRGHQSTSCNWQKQKHSLLVTGEDLVRIGASTGRWAEKDIWKVVRHGDQADKALVGVPLVMGRSGIAFFVPWVPVLAFMDLTILFGIEGLACRIMVLPIFFIFPSLGGFIAHGTRKSQRNNRGKFQGAVVLFLPLLLAPLEELLPHGLARYEAYACVDIHASARNIWNRVLKVRLIIMKDIQNNILGILKTRCEGKL